MPMDVVEKEYIAEQIAERLGWKLWVTRQRLNQMGIAPARVGQRGRRYYRERDVSLLAMLDEQVRRGIWTWEQAIKAEQVIRTVFDQSPQGEPDALSDFPADLMGKLLERIILLESRLDQVLQLLETLIPMLPELIALLNERQQLGPAKPLLGES